MKISKKFKESLLKALSLVAVLWVVHIFQFITNIDLGFLGIYPRHSWGLRGVITAPLIHADWHHLISNSVPLLVLGTTTFFFYERVALRSYLMIYLLTGLTVWILARDVFHIGASGVVYGLVSFIFWNGIFRKSLQSIVLALIVTFLYSGYFAGILPNQEGISWESHLLGGLVGIFVAYYFKEEIELAEKIEPASWELEPDKAAAFFLSRDIFEKTKAERLKEQQEEEDNNNNTEWYTSNTYDDW